MDYNISRPRVHSIHITEAATKLLKIVSWEAIRADPGALSAALVPPVADRIYDTIIARRAHVCPRRAWTPKDRFSLTPIGLYGDLVRIAQQSISSWGDDQRRRETRMRGGLEEDAKGKEEAQKPVGGAATPMRPKDKYGVELALAA